MRKIEWKKLLREKLTTPAFCYRSLPLIDTDKLFINEKRLREEHRRITQRLSEIQLSDQAALRGTPADQQPQMQIPSNKHFHHRLSQHPHLHPSHKPYVSRTYIGGSATSSLALKIQRSKHQQNMNLNGSLSSLHETSLNSGRSLTKEFCLLYLLPPPHTYLPSTESLIKTKRYPCFSNTN